MQTLFCRRKSKLFVEAGIVLAIYPVGSISSVVDCCLLRSKMHKSCLIWTSFKSNSINSDWRLSNNILKTKSKYCLLWSRNHVISGLFKLLEFILFFSPESDLRLSIIHLFVCNSISMKSHQWTFIISFSNQSTIISSTLAHLFCDF